MSSDDMDVEDGSNSTKECCRQEPHNEPFRNITAWENEPVRNIPTWENEPVRNILTWENEPVKNIPNWETLPYPVTVVVFSYLCDKDRVAMAQVCRAWSNCFKNPSLWRTRKFTLNGHRDHRNIYFTSIFGKCLQNVDLLIWYGLQRNLESIEKSVKDVTRNLKKARLHHLKLHCISFKKYKKFPKRLNTIYKRIIKMFQTQTELKKVTLASCSFSQSIGTEVLKTLATSTGKELVYLDITKYIDRILNVNDLETLKETLTKFSNLTDISINFSYISDEVLRHWAVSLRHKLQSMRIVVSNREPLYHIIQSGTWRQLNSSCPKLKVSIAIYELPQAKEIISILQPSIPLTTFIMMSGLEASQMAATLKHLAGCFHHCLKYLRVECEELNDIVDERLVDVLERCRRLQTFRFTGNVGIMVPKKIFDLLKDSQSALCSCEISDNLSGVPNPDQDAANKINVIESILPLKDVTVNSKDDAIFDNWALDIIDY